MTIEITDLPGKLLEEVVIPTAHGKAFVVKKDLILRITEMDGPQACDMAVFKADDYKEVYDPTVTYILNVLEGTGNGRKITNMYSRPPRMNLMLKVIDDKVGVHWVLSGARCNSKVYELVGVKGYHRNCQDNLAEAISEFGLTPDDVPDVFNIFQKVDYSPEGIYEFKSLGSKEGDYIDFMTHMDCLVALSACPSDDPSLTDRLNRGLIAEIFEKN